MIAVDTNLLGYAHRRESSFYHAAYEILRHLGGRGQALGHSMAMLL